jgi:hypothetical protein
MPQLSPGLNTLRWRLVGADGAAQRHGIPVSERVRERERRGKCVRERECA